MSNLLAKETCQIFWSPRKSRPDRFFCLTRGLVSKVTLPDGKLVGKGNLSGLFVALEDQT
jgi:hypothetical protein